MGGLRPNVVLQVTVTGHTSCMDCGCMGGMLGGWVVGACKWLYEVGTGARGCNGNR